MLGFAKNLKVTLGLGRECRSVLPMKKTRVRISFPIPLQKLDVFSLLSPYRGACQCIVKSQIVFELFGVRIDTREWLYFL